MNHRSGKPPRNPAGQPVPVGVSNEGRRGDVWRAAALQAHMMSGPTGPPGPRRRPMGGQDRNSGYQSSSSEPPPQNRPNRDSVQAHSSQSGSSSTPRCIDNSESEAYIPSFAQKMEKYQASLNLAQKMDLVPKPAAPLTEQEWEAVKHCSDGRDESDKPCSICMDDFRTRPQVILSCSHVFHQECIESFERFARIKCCPLCRKQNYDKALHKGGFNVWRTKCSMRIQKAWRGYRQRLATFEALKHMENKSEAPALRKLVVGRALQGVSDRLIDVSDRHEDELDKFLNSLDESVSKCSAQVRNGLQGIESLHGGPVAAVRSSGSAVPSHTSSGDIPVSTSAAVSSTAPADAQSAPKGDSSGQIDWEWAKDQALSRDSECPICFQDMGLEDPKARVELLSCSHVFHRCCLLSFESFHVFEKHSCPCCRQEYERKPWGSVCCSRPLPSHSTEHAAASSSSSSPGVAETHVRCNAPPKKKASAPPLASMFKSSRQLAKERAKPQGNATKTSGSSASPGIAMQPSNRLPASERRHPRSSSTPVSAASTQSLRTAGTCPSR
eukprot:gnl/MRDRNA2_/MRDRNA2_140569_c0_seq1.p1 gnl/MRDRNA2_/MRDRNA2_140569_c0~~gnl/MRDRNA2_/MRDRNA2_140569_c0_seq1.p1  ORF type:complete len:555 (-),score=93.82 gnl/MRDRNA2_/MRDRNA2_140569_c0_seq1:44-1708(-)